MRTDYGHRSEIYREVRHCVAPLATRAPTQTVLAARRCDECCAPVDAPSTVDNRNGASICGSISRSVSYNQCNSRLSKPRKHGDLVYADLITRQGAARVQNCYHVRCRQILPDDAINQTGLASDTSTVLRHVRDTNDAQLTHIVPEMRAETACITFCAPAQPVLTTWAGQMS
jgi:hypothetical protein